MEVYIKRPKNPVMMQGEGFPPEHVEPSALHHGLYQTALTTSTTLAGLQPSTVTALARGFLGRA